MVVKAAPAPLQPLKARRPEQLEVEACRCRGLALFNNEFIGGHCYFEAFAISSKAALGVGDFAGAPLIRQILDEYGYGEFRQYRLLLTRHIDQKDRKRAPCYDQAKADVADIAAGDKTFRSDVDLAS